MKFKDLGITTPQDLLIYLQKNVKYGFTHGGKVFTEEEPTFMENFNKFYKIKLGKNLIKSGYGVCWDLTEFERLFFEEYGIEHECYFFLSFKNRQEGGPTHTFTLFKQNEKWCWFEFSWAYCRGIWEYETKEEALENILERFAKNCGKSKENIEAYKIDKVRKPLNAYEIVNHFMAGEKISI